MSTQLRDYGPINAWIQKLDHRRLIPETAEKTQSFLKYNRNTIICQGMLLLCALLLGGIQLHFGYVMSLSYLVMTCTSTCLFLMVIRNMDCLREMMTDEFRPYLSRWNIVKGKTGLKTREKREEFFCISGSIYKRTNNCVRLCRTTGFLLFLYTGYRFVMEQASLLSIFTWNSWNVLQAAFIWVQQSNILWLFGIWFLLKRHLDLQLDQLISWTIDTLELTTPDLQVKLVAEFKTYKSLSKKIMKFNCFSTEFLVVLVASCSIFIGIFTFAAQRAGHHNPINFHTYIILIIGFSFVSTVLLHNTSSIAQKSNKLNILFHSISARKSRILSRGFKRSVAVIVKNTSTGRNSALGLTYFDERACNSKFFFNYCRKFLELVALFLCFLRNL